jgi:TatD DNase family protein
MFIVDSHCHLNFKPLFSDLDKVLERAAAAEVKLMQNICTKISEFEEIRLIAERHDNVFCSVGVHPHEAEKEGAIEVKDLASLSNHPKVIGIGETGLDYYYEHSDRKFQKTSFITHVNVSRETLLPLIIHNRNSDKDMIDILRTEMKAGEFKGVLHCFSSTEELAKAALDLGLYISMSGIVTFKNARKLRNIVKNIPLDRLLVETDSPYLAPEPMRGKKNEPSFALYIVKYLANLLGETPEKIAETTTQNFFRLFGKKVT